MTTTHTIVVRTGDSELVLPKGVTPDEWIKKDDEFRANTVSEEDYREACRAWLLLKLNCNSTDQTSQGKCAATAAVSNLSLLGAIALNPAVFLSLRSTA